jgi:NAD(P)-dependent dehydrogenase (short-subunit alcohol dehydrogenase family)
MAEARNGVAIVTGGSSPGIGRDISFTLARRGWKVRSMGLGKDVIEETHREAKDDRLDVRCFEGDVTSSKEIEAFRKWIGNPGPIRALVNNAAIRPTGTVLTTDEKTWDEVFAVNVKGTFLVTKAFLPSIIEAGGGSIVNLSSCSSQGSANLVAYSSSKLALIAFTRCTAEDFKKQRVRVNAILPGPIRSGMLQGIPEEVLELCRQEGVQGRLGEGRDVANAVAFLISEEAETISGTELRVNYWPGLFG